MSEPTLRPIWTPDDYWQAVRDAARHTEPRGEAIAAEDMEPDVLPAPARGRTSTAQPCPSCWAWCDEECEPDCIQQMSPQDAQRLRVNVVDGILAELDLLDEDQDDDDHPRLAGPHHAEPAPTEWVRVGRAIAAGVTVALVLTVGALWAASHAKADTPGCATQFWLIPFQSNTRTICDGPVQPDGSWLRAREFWSPAYTTRARSSCSGGYSYSSCTYYPERFVPMRSKGVERYVVTPETVLADEPGHLA